MMDKQWSDLLWQDLTGSLSPEERRIYHQMLAENNSRREELRDWLDLREAVREEVSERVPQAPPLTADFFRQLDAVGTLPPDPHARAPLDALSGIGSAQNRWQRPSRRTTLPLIAAIAAMLMLIVALLVTGNRGQDPYAAQIISDTLRTDSSGSTEPQILRFQAIYGTGGITVDSITLIWETRGTHAVTIESGALVADMFVPGDVYKESGLPANGTISYGPVTPGNDMARLCISDPPPRDATPICAVAVFTAPPRPGPSATWTPSFTPSLTMTGAHTTGAPSRTPSAPGRTGASTATELPWVADPALSITPSVNTPIISSPARLLSEARLPEADIGQKALWSSADTLIYQGMDGVWMYDDANLSNDPHLLPAPQNGFVDAVVSPDGRRIATLDWNQRLTLWQAQTGEVIATVEDPGLWDDLQFGPEGSTLISRLEHGRVDFAGEGTPIVSSLPVQGYDSNYLLSPDGEVLYVIDRTGGQILTVDAETGAALSRWQTSDSFVRSRNITQDGRVLALGQDDGQIRLLDTQTGQEVAAMPHTGRVSSLEFSPDGSMLAYVVDARPSFSLWVWHIDRAEVFVIMTYDLEIGGPAFSPDGDALTVVTTDGRAMVIDVTPMQ